MVFVHVHSLVGRQVTFLRVKSCYSICRGCTKFSVIGCRIICWSWVHLRHLSTSSGGERGSTKIKGSAPGGENIINLSLTRVVVGFKVGVLVKARVMLTVVYSMRRYIDLVRLLFFLLNMVGQK